MPTIRPVLPLALMFLAIAVAHALAAPPAPSGFVVHAPSPCGSIELTWNPLPNVIGYTITRNGDPIAQVGDMVKEYFDFDASSPILYNYCITAYDKLGVSPPSCGSTTQVASGINVDPADWLHDVFPVNTVLSPPGTTSFDSTTAVLKTGHNLSACTGSDLRDVIPGDNVFISVPGGVDRVDMIFRIKPGPCNYLTCGMLTSGLRKFPSSPGSGISAPGDGTFWGTYMAGPGAFASPGAAGLHAAAPSGWDVNVWNSAQCELEVAGLYRSTLFGSGGAPILRTRYFTPGSHVEYFFRVHYAAGAVNLFPDTACVMQIATDHDGHGHRWREISVLPDRWKDPSYGGTETPCMLVVDYSHNNFEQHTWVSIADSIAATAPKRFGASTGWHAVGLVPTQAPVNLDDPVNNRRPDGTMGFVSAHLGQPGTTWDLYSVLGTQEDCTGHAGDLGGRYGVVPAGQVPPGPTLGMLTTYYKIILLLTGDDDSQILGRVPDRSQNDVFILDSYLKTAAGGPHALIVQGGGFAESEDADGAAHQAFLNGTLGTGYLYHRYADTYADTDPIIDLDMPTLLPCYRDAYGLASLSFLPENVLDFALPEAAAAGCWKSCGLLDHIASVYKPNAPAFARPWVSLVQAWSLPQLVDPFAVTSYGRLAYYHCLFNSAIVAPICELTGSPLLTIDVPASKPANGGLRMLGVRNNPLESGEAALEFENGQDERLLVRIYDLAGRTLRTLADRRFEPGVHSVLWDGTAEDGRAASRGVYFARIVSRARGETLSQRVIVLK